MTPSVLFSAKAADRSSVVVRVAGSKTSSRLVGGSAVLSRRLKTIRQSAATAGRAPAGSDNPSIAEKPSSVNLRSSSRNPTDLSATVTISSAAQPPRVKARPLSLRRKSRSGLNCIS